MVLGTRTMMSSQGQIFRGLLPGNLVGNVSYRVRSTDEYGNSGTSGDQVYVASYGATFAVKFGAGSAGPGGVPTLDAPSIATSDSSFFLALSGASPSTGWFVFVTDAGLAAPLALPGLGLVNVGGNVIATFDGTTDASGSAAIEIPIGSGLPVGASLFAQGFAVDGVGGNLLSSTRGLEVITQ